MTFRLLLIGALRRSTIRTGKQIMCVTYSKYAKFIDDRGGDVRSFFPSL